MDDLDHWNVCKEFSIVQAALIIAGLDPASFQYTIEDMSIFTRPEAYEAAKAALVNSVESTNLSANIHRRGRSGDIDLYKTTILGKDLRAFLLDRKKVIESNKESDRQSYLDPDHPHYAPKLAAVVSAWLEVEGDPELERLSPKQVLTRWLRNNAQNFELTNAEGDPIESSIEECARVANWKPGKGRHKKRS